MPDHQKVARDIMTLLQTIEEGMDHINSRIQEDNILDTSYFFDDIVLAVTSVLRSFEPLYPHLRENRVLEFSDRLIAAMDAMTAGYEQKDEEKTVLALQNLLPVYQMWHSELESCLRLFTAC